MSDPDGLFITGTDTGVGKTFVTAALARLLRQQGHSVAVCKPVATGASLVRGKLLADDTLRLAEAAGIDDMDRVTRWSFPDPASPPVAARVQGIVLSLDDIVQFVREQSGPGKLVLVEGVGGLLCPLTETQTIADLAAILKVPLVVVARCSLGTLNHTLLTLEAARGHGLTVTGVVVSETSPPRDLADQSNVEELRRRIDVPILAVVPYQADASTAPSGLDAVDWRSLCKGEPWKPFR